MEDVLPILQQGKHGLDGFLTAIRQNMFGIFCGMMIIVLGNLFPFAASPFVFSGLLSFVICIAGALDFFAFIPGTFLGCFCTFAANGDWKLLIPSMIVGALLGLTCDLGGDLLFSMFGKSEAEKAKLKYCRNI